MSFPAHPVKILPLTSARIFAALYIFLYHLALSGDVPQLQRDNVLSRFAHLGYVSVSFFFVLSGFVLALANLHQRSAFSPRDFFIARFARIYPSLALCLLLDLARVLCIPGYFRGYSPKHIAWILLSSFAALEAWFQQLLALDPPTWTISAEIFFYLLFPILGVLLWRMRPRLLLATTLTLYTLSNLTLLFLIHHHSSTWNLYLNPIHHLPTFLLGICLAKYFTAAPQRLSPLAPAALTLSLCAFLLMPIINLPILAPLLQHSLLAPLFALVILALCSGQKLLTSIFSARWLVLLGEASFTLYLIHFPALHLFHPVIAASPLLGASLCLAACIAYSVASFLWFETPTRRLVTRKFAIHSRESTAVASLAQ